MSPAITAHGGPVMAGTPDAYLIWYGNWNQNNGSDTPAGQQLVRDFLSGIGDSPYFKINSTYTGVPGCYWIRYSCERGNHGSRIPGQQARVG